MDGRHNDLAIWLRDGPLTVEQLADLLSVTIGIVYGWRRGKRQPSLDMAIRLEEISSGAVTCMSWKRAPRPRPVNK